MLSCQPEGADWKTATGRRIAAEAEAIGVAMWAFFPRCAWCAPRAGRPREFAQRTHVAP